MTVGNEPQETPEGWCSASILELCDIIRGVSYARGEVAAFPGEMVKSCG